MKFRQAKYSPCWNRFSEQVLAVYRKFTNSLDKLLAKLRAVSALRMGESKLWRVALMTKKQRDYFSLLGVLPPKGRLQLL